MSRKLTLTVVLLAVLLGGTAGQTAQAKSISVADYKISSHSAIYSCPERVKGVEYYINKTREWQTGLNLQVTKSDFNPFTTFSCKYVKWVAHIWIKRAHRLRLRYTAYEVQQAKIKAQENALPAHYQGWLCIHNGEGAWSDATGNGYYGGLQMTYGWLGYISGQANWLTPLQQMQAAERGFADSGYSISWLEGQWPNTSPPCLQYF